jgi:hypothetical protein
MTSIDSVEQKRKVMTLYSLLCSSDKKASINYLVDVGNFCKEKYTSIRRTRYKKTLNELLNDI